MKELCERCKEEEVMEGYPVCCGCYNFYKQWGDSLQKQRMRYFDLKAEMEKNPELKKQLLEHRHLSHKLYINKNRDKWNAYQREYYKRRKDKMKALEEEVARLKAQQTAVNS